MTAKIKPKTTTAILQLLVEQKQVLIVSISWLAEKLGKSLSVVSRTVKRLETRGDVYIDHFDFKKPNGKARTVTMIGLTFKALKTNQPINANWIMPCCNVQVDFRLTCATGEHKRCYYCGQVFTRSKIKTKPLQGKAKQRKRRSPSLEQRQNKHK